MKKLLNKIKEKLMLNVSDNGIKNNESGSALVLTLMVLLVLSVLGSAVGAVTMGSYKLGDVTRDSNSAYYIAEAGANLAYEEIESKVLTNYTNSNGDKTTYFNLMANEQTSNKEYKEFEPQDDEQPVAVVSVERVTDSVEDNFQLYEITSTGKVGNQERTVTKPFSINWKKSQTEEVVEGPITVETLGGSLILKNKLTFTGGTINGDAYIDKDGIIDFDNGRGGSKGSGNIYSNVEGIDGREGQIYTNVPATRDISNFTDKTEYKDFIVDWDTYNAIVNSPIEIEPVAELTVPPVSENDLDITPVEDITLNEIDYESYANMGSSKNTVTVNGNTRFENLEFTSSNSKLIVNTTNNSVTNIVVDNLTFKNGGNIEINGNGQVNIYINESFNIDNTQTFGNNKNSTRLNIYNLGNTNVNIDDVANFYGNIYSKGNVSYVGKGNWGEYKGNINSEGNISIKNVPIVNGDFNANNSVSITGSGNFEGNISSSGTAEVKNFQNVTGDVKSNLNVSIAGPITGANTYSGDITSLANVVVRNYQNVTSAIKSESNVNIIGTGGGSRYDGDIVSKGTVISENYQGITSDIRSDSNVTLTGTGSGTYAGNITSNSSVTINNIAKVNNPDVDNDDKTIEDVIVATEGVYLNNVAIVRGNIISSKEVVSKYTNGTTLNGDIKSGGLVTVHNLDALNGGIEANRDVDLIGTGGSSISSTSGISGYGEVRIKDFQNLTGNIKSNEGIDLDGRNGANITANLISIGAVSVDNFQSLSGNIESNGIVNLTGTTSPKINGNIAATKNILLNGIAEINGDIKSNSDINLENPDWSNTVGNIFAGGNLSAKGKINGIVLVPQGTMGLDGQNSSITGTLIANNVNMFNGSINYEEHTVTVEIPEGSLPEENNPGTEIIPVSDLIVTEPATEVEQ